MTIREEIDTQFPIRKTAAQKRAFEKWVMAKMREMGYRPYVDGMNRKDKLRHRNIVAGDPQNAELLISAHYDTAATIGVPDLRIPRNFPVYILSQGAVLLGMLLISLLIGTAVGLATKSGDWLILTFFFAYLALMLLMMFGAANKHNVNDNTSGIAALLETMQRLSPEAREKTAFILFDHQETGSRGAKSYGAQHVEVQTMKLLVDLNCVGDGNTFVISAPKMAQDKPEYAAVRESLEANAMASGVSTQFFGRAGVQGAGDYRRFVCGVGVSAYHHSAGVGLITGRIHTSRDTVCRQENLDYLAKSLADAAFFSAFALQFVPEYATIETRKAPCWQDWKRRKQYAAASFQGIPRHFCRGDVCGVRGAVCAGGSAGAAGRAASADAIAAGCKSGAVEAPADAARANRR